VIKNKLFSRFIFLAFTFSFLNSYIAFLFVEQYEKQYDTYAYVKSYAATDLFYKLKLTTFFSNKTINECLSHSVERQTRVNDIFEVARVTGTDIISIKVSSYDKSKNELCINSVLEDITEFNKQDDISRLASYAEVLHFIKHSKGSFIIQNLSSVKEFISSKNKSIFSAPFTVKKSINAFLIIFLVFILSFVAFIYIYYLSKKIAKVKMDLF